jgi:multiple sugar transport system substrate-binding protein
MKEVQGWYQAGLVDPNTDDAAFIQRRAALSWAGHWEYPRYSKALGEDLLLLPLPDFAKGSRTGQGSWAWALTKQCKNQEAAKAFLEFLLRPEEILAMTNANGAVPATQSAVARSPLYSKEGPLRLFVTQLRTTALPRPITPAYPVITSVFEDAFDDILNGRDVKETLDEAVSSIDEDIRDNKGYP